MAVEGTKRNRTTRGHVSPCAAVFCLTILACVKVTFGIRPNTLATLQLEHAPRITVRNSISVQKGDHQSSSDKHVNPLRKLTPPRLGDGPGPNTVMTATPDALTGAAEWVTVSWANISFPGYSDYVAMHCPPAPANTSQFTMAPLEYQYVGPPDTRANSSGTVRFQVLNRRQDCQFVYVSGSAVFPYVGALSNVVRFSDYQQPTGIHLALGADPSEMQVLWTQLTDDTPVVTYGTEPGHYTHHASAQVTRVRVEDMCDREAEPAGQMGWFDPGPLWNATMTGLVPGQRYYYRVGTRGWLGFGGEMSEEMSFLAAPAVGAHQATVIAAWGDQGNAPKDGARQKSFDWGNRGELPAPNTTASVLRALQAAGGGSAPAGPGLALHIGDISYAVGFLAEWDQFFAEAQPLASQVAWQAAIGNHEQGWSGSFYPQDDSGGECGVLYNAHFPFAAQPGDASMGFQARRPWYSFDYGSVHVTVMSTEHDFRSGSEQHAWLARDLAAVDRARTPWLLFSGHRPMYVSSYWKGDGMEARQLQTEVEPLLVANKVDLAIWGHFHAYERTCAQIGGRCVSASNATAHGVPHIVMGTAGYELTRELKNATDWEAWVVHAEADHYGFVRLDFLNTTHLRTQFVNNGDARVLDEGWFSRQL